MVACLESQKMEKLKEKNELVSKVQQPSWARQEPPNQSGMLVQTCTSSTLEGKPRGRGVQSHQELSAEFKANPSTEDPVLNTPKTRWAWLEEAFNPFSPEAGTGG